MAKLSERDKEALKADHISGEFTQQDLADKYGISKGMVNRYVKPSKSKHIIDEEVRIRGELYNIELEKSKHLSKQEIIEVNKIVNERVRISNKVFSIQERALDKADTMIDQVDTPNDLRTIVELVDKASITLKVSDRHAPKQDINLTNAQQNNNQKQIIVTYE